MKEELLIVARAGRRSGRPQTPHETAAATVFTTKLVRLLAHATLIDRRSIMIRMETTRRFSAQILLRLLSADPAMLLYLR